jgi:hypothetical protein
MRWKMRVWKCDHVIQFSIWKEGWKQVSVIVNGFQGVQAPAVDGSTCPRHKKIQLYEIYVRWTSKLIFLSLFAAINGDIYQQETINKFVR